MTDFDIVCPLILRLTTTTGTNGVEKVINMSENLAVECWHLWKFPYFYKSS